MKPGADFKERRDAPAHDRAAGRGLGDAGEELEQRRFASAVAADDAQHFSGLDRERDVAQRPELAFFGFGFPTAHPVDHPGKILAQRRRANDAKTVFLREVFDLYNRKGHWEKLKTETLKS